MGLIRFIQAHNRNKQLKEMRKLKEQELDILEDNQIREYQNPNRVKKPKELNLNGLNVHTMYDEAYNLHYKEGNLADAHYIYREIINRFPDSEEAKYSKTQIENIEKSANFVCFEECEEEIDDDNNELESDAIKILKLRYAKGEISKAEYLEMKKELKD